MMNMKTILKKNTISVTARKSHHAKPSVGTKWKSTEIVCECDKNFHFLDKNEGMWIFSLQRNEETSMGFFCCY